MRYTEVRLENLSDLLLADLERGTVNFGPNYDNKEEEPLVSPNQVSAAFGKWCLRHCGGYGNKYSAA